MNSKTKEKWYSNLCVCLVSFLKWFNKDFWTIFCVGIIELLWLMCVAVSIYCAVISTRYIRLMLSIVAIVFSYAVYRFHTYYTFCHLCRNIHLKRIRRIRKEEEFRKYFIRPLFYVVTIFLIINAHWLKSGLTVWLVQAFTAVKITISVRVIKATGLIVLSLVLLLTAFETLSRRTFRKWPVYFLSLALGLLFLVFMDIPYKNQELTWGLVNTVQMEHVLNNLPGTISSSILAAIAVSFVFFLVRDRWTKLQKKLTEDIVKETRRQLLSHWDFRPMSPLSNNSLNRIIVLFAAICLIAGIMVFADIPNKTGASITVGQTTGDTGHVKPNVDMPAPAVTAKQKGIDGAIILEQGNNDTSVETKISATSEESKEGENKISFTGYLFILAVVFAAIGIATHFDVSNKSLIESEYYYLLYHSLDAFWDPTWKETFDGARELRRSDYFQVMSYLYSSGSTIKSEEYEWHKLGAVLTKLYKNSAAEGQSGKGAFLSRMLYFYAEIKEQISLNQEMKEESVNPLDRLRLEQTVPVPEMMFTREIIAQLKDTKLQFGWCDDEKNIPVEEEREATVSAGERADELIMEGIKAVTSNANINILFERISGEDYDIEFLQSAIVLYRKIAQSTTFNIREVENSLSNLREMKNNMLIDEEGKHSDVIDRVSNWLNELTKVLNQ